MKDKYSKTGGNMIKSMVCAAVVCLALINCSPRPPLAQDTGKGTIVVLCGNSLIDTSAVIGVTCNNRVVANLTVQSYCEFDMLDGMYSLQAGSSDPAQSTVPLKVDVNVASGGIKYFDIVPQDFGVAPGIYTLKEISGANASVRMAKMKKISMDSKH